MTVYAIAQDAFNGWAQSPEYQAISRNRLAGADTVVLLLKGLQ